MSPEKTQQNSGSKRILLVEDEPALSHAMQMKLAHAGFEIVTVPNGKDGLRQALEGSYDLILSDIIMPELDGFSLLAALKEHGIKTPVIILSNLAQEEDKKRVRELGARDYIVKSVTPIAEILLRIQGVLS